MREDKTTQILKNAILLEKRGRAVYGQIAEQAAAEEVKAFFRMMAVEENKHIQVLSEQFKAYQKNIFMPVRDESGKQRRVQVRVVIIVARW